MQKKRDSEVGSMGLAGGRDTGVPFIVQRLEEHTTRTAHIEQRFIWINGLQIPALPLVRTYLRGMGEER